MVTQDIRVLHNSNLLCWVDTLRNTQNSNYKTKVSFKNVMSELQATIDFPKEMDSDAYKKSLEEKFGIRVTEKYFNKDQASMDRLGGSMNGNDVVIAPNILEQMVNNKEKAVYYEAKIQYYFDNIPKWKGEFAAMGLSYEPCGVAIHEDGTVYYIGGCTETPERKAKIAAAQKAKEEQKIKHLQEQRDYNKWLFEHKRIIAKIASDDAALDMIVANDMMVPFPIL